VVIFQQGQPPAQTGKKLEHRFDSIAFRPAKTDLKSSYVQVEDMSLSYQKRTAVVGGLIVSLLILSGLFPYHWTSAANPFCWIPFRGFLEADREGGMLIFLRKCF